MVFKLFGFTFGRSEEDEQRIEEEWYDKKSAYMADILGPEHDMVMHAIIPYEVGGALDLYYFPNGIEGTAVATKELSYALRKSSSNRKFKKYELVMFTRVPLDLDDAKDEDTPFGKAHHYINSVLNPVARYSEMAELNPGDTSEFPTEFEGIGGKCFIFSDYGSKTEAQEPFGLMTLIEIHRNEMAFARENSGEELIERLKEKGVFPYSNTDRPPVV